MNFIGTKQRQIRNLGKKLKTGAYIGLKAGRNIGRNIQSGAGQVEVIRRKLANTAGMIDRTATNLLPLASLTPLGAIPGFNQGAALGLVGLKAGRKLLENEGTKNLIKDVGKVGRGIERQSDRQLDNLQQLTSDFM